MKACCAILLASLLLMGCSAREQFQSKLRSLKIGTANKQVEQMLGKPSHVYTRTNYWGTWLVGGSEWWDYSDTSREGEVWFDDRGEVRYVYARTGRILPPQ